MKTISFRVLIRPEGFEEEERQPVEKMWKALICDIRCNKRKTYYVEVAWFYEPSELKQELKLNGTEKESQKDV